MNDGTDWQLAGQSRVGHFDDFPRVPFSQDCQWDFMPRHQVDKVGFGLRIDDLPNHFPLREDVQQWEGRFWREEVEPGVFHAEIDTTFAMYRPPTRDAGERALRTGTPYVARHTPWYVDPAVLTDEDRYYREHADPTISNWDREELPAWKRRWLDNFAELDRLAATEAGGHQ